MADKTIPELTAAGALSGTESFHIVQGGESRELTLAELAEYVKTAETIVPANLPHKGARAYRSSDLTGVTFPIIVSWNAEDFDTDGFFDAGSPTRFTIPAGITKVQFTGQISFTSAAAAGGLFVALRKNTTGTGTMDPSVPGFPVVVTSRTTSGYTTNLIQFSSGVISVVEGDYFDIRVNSTVAGVNSILGTAGTGSSWFELQVVEHD